MRAAITLAASMALCMACSGTTKSPVETKARTAPEAGTTSTFVVSTAHRVRESSGVAVVTLDERTMVLVADGDDHVIRAFDAATFEPLGVTELESAPHDLVVAVNGRVYVTLPETNVVVGFEAAAADGSLREVVRFRTAVEPLATALPPLEDALYVVTGASHRLESFDTSTGARTSSRDVAREPRAVLVAGDGERVFVSHAASSDLGVYARGAGRDETPGVSLGLPTVFDYGPTPPPREARLAYSMVRMRIEGDAKLGAHEEVWIPLVQQAPWGGSPDGYGKLPVTTPLPDCFSPTTPNGRSNFDVRRVRTASATTPLRAENRTQLPRSCLLPRASIAAGSGVLVACEGSSEVVLFELAKDWPHPRTTWHVPRGPSAIARVPGANRAIVWSSLARGLATIDLGSDAVLIARDVPRSRAMDPAEIAGREIFRRTGDTSISRDGVACASCHPDGRDDGLVWESPNGRRRPPTLAGNVARSGPFGWGGEHPTLEAHVNETVKRLGGRGLSENDRTMLLAYLRAMRPVPAAPRPSDDPIVARGNEVFHSDRAACATCHEPANPPGERDVHDVGSGGPFVTPLLAGAGARPSFFHDGRYRSLDALFEGATRMGGAAQLTPSDRAALVAYVKTL